MEISIDNFKLVLDKLKPYTDYLYFHIKGEPLLHPNIIELLEIANNKGFYVNLTTNGTLINLLKKPLLEKVPLRQVNISLHSFEGNKEEEFRKYLHTIIDFAKEVTTKTPTYVALRLWNLNKDISTEQRARNIEVLETIEREFKLEVPIETKLDNEKGTKIAHNLYLNYDYEFTWPALDADFIGDIGYCYGLKTQLGILVDGTVIPCCLDGEGIVKLGNIYDQSINDILESTRVKEIQNGFRDRKVVEPLCQRCGYRERF
jgi:radical SAM protein with 4Fe4S-binding SPASM domain